ncbi:MAG: hypothetical protein AAF492_14290, partial [Verrucomicrobiota bacterium]
MHTNNAEIHHAALIDLGRTDKKRELDDIYFDINDDAPGNQTSAFVDFTTRAGPATNVRGRYALHFHRGGNSPGSTAANVAGCVVRTSPGWGFVNHSAHVHFVNNVAYGVQGTAFYTEAGDEIGSMVGNIAIRSVSPTFTLDDAGAIDPDLRAEVQDFGVDGEGYWLSGHLVSLVDNVSAGASAHGFIIWSDGLVEADRGRATVRVSDIPNGHLITNRDSIPTWWAPMAEIKNNISYGAVVGFRSRYVHSNVYLGETGSPFHQPPPQAYIETLNPVVDGLTVWGSRDGVLLNYNERLSIRNARLIGTGAPWVQNGGTADHGVGLDMHNEVSRGPGVIENVSIEGFGVGLLAPRHDEWTITNLSLRNATDMYVKEPVVGPRKLAMSDVSFGPLSGTAVAGQEVRRRRVVLEMETEESGFQPYAFLLPDRITLDGQGLYSDQQAAGYIPLRSRPEEGIVSVSSEFVGLTNRQLHNRFGTSFGGALLPAGASRAAHVAGGFVGPVAPDPIVFPPLYDMTNEGGSAILIQEGNLNNFTQSPAAPDNGDEPDDGEDHDDDGGDQDHDGEDSEDHDDEGEDSEDHDGGGDQDHDGEDSEDHDDEGEDHDHDGEDSEDHDDEGE